MRVISLIFAIAFGALSIVSIIMAVKKNDTIYYTYYSLIFDILMAICFIIPMFIQRLI